MIKKLLLFVLLMNIIVSYTNCQIKTVEIDSSFTLLKKIRQDKLFINGHGVIIYSFNYKVLGGKIKDDFKKMEALAKVKLVNYYREVINDGNHLVKIWKPNGKAEGISALTELALTYYIDTTIGNTVITDTVRCWSYFIQLRRPPYFIHYVTIDKQGVEGYSIGNREMVVNGEMVLVSLMYARFKLKDDIEMLCKKYGIANKYLHN